MNLHGNKPRWKQQTEREKDKGHRSHGCPRGRRAEGGGSHGTQGSPSTAGARGHGGQAGDDVHGGSLDGLRGA
eukprot:2974683-Pyramimonas_sp.AAC.5